MRFIYGSDWHIRHTNPKCRTDNYANTIIKKLNWLSYLQKQERNIPIVSGGDLFDKDVYKSPSDVVQTLKLVSRYLPDMVGSIGNHSLLHRSYEYLEKSTISVLIASGKLHHIQGHIDLDKHTRLHGFDYGTGGIKHSEDLIDGCNIAIMHEYVSKKPNSLFGKYVGKDLLKEFPEYQIILTGDNHTTFIEEYGGRFLINPGSFLRMDADQVKHKPCVFIVDTENMSFEKRFVPIEDGVISREHLQIQKDRQDRIESFVESFEEEYEISDSFNKNIENYLNENRADKETNEIKISKNVEKFINIAIGGDLEACGY